jgi:uncharacterized protein (DUF1330 family)
MKAYILVRVDIKDPERYKDYLKLTPALIARHGGRAIVRAGQKETLEGPVESRRLAVLEFPSMAKAREFYHSAEYQEAKKIRDSAAVGELILVEGAPETL